MKMNTRLISQMMRAFVMQKVNSLTRRLYTVSQSVLLLLRMMNDEVRPPPQNNYLYYFLKFI